MRKHINLDAFIELVARNKKVWGQTESLRYRIQAILKRYENAFEKKEVYPHLFDLLRFQASLKKLRREFTQIDSDWKKAARVEDFSLSQRRVSKPEISSVTKSATQITIDLIDWVQPLVSELIKKGIQYREEIKKELVINTVGMINVKYSDEGYLFIPEWNFEIEFPQWAAFSFERKQAFTDIHITSLPLRCKRIRTESYLMDPITLKGKLREQYPKKSFLNTFSLDISDDFPLEDVSFTKSVLPIATQLVRETL